MAEARIKRALISVYDKTGIVDFTRALTNELGIEIISTGGTAALLKRNGIPVTLVEEITGFPELMDGRVKTLHPMIHAAILADRDDPEHVRQLAEHGIKPIDMVVVDLYPFGSTVAEPECTLERALEMIDIGGPCLLRAAAKNHRHVLPVGDQSLYEGCLDFLRGEGHVDEIEVRRHLATRAFDITSEYDIEVQCYLDDIGQQLEIEELPVGDDRRVLIEEGGGWGQWWATSKTLRYGENPHQQAAYLGGEEPAPASVAPEHQIAGAEASFNNYSDADAASELCKELTRGNLGHPHVVTFIKHTNACGVGVADDRLEAYRRAYLGDPNATMGGVLACNFAVDPECATAVMETYDRWGKEAGVGGFFVEAWVAPSFDAPAMEIIKAKRRWGERVRLLSIGDMKIPPDAGELSYRSINGGTLAQTRDVVGLNEGQWKVVTKRAPTDAELADLRLAWLICKHTKSNAITICRDSLLIGNGAGQMSRVMSCRVATWLAGENGHSERLAGAVAASDAFFPFADGPNILMDAGVTAVIQPGGGKRDEDTIKACNDRGAAMVFTGTRHFKH